VTIDIGNNSIQLIDVEKSEDWQITLIDTGLNAGTAERLLRIRQSLDQERPFLLTYGDGVGNINVQDLYNFHSENEQSVTLTAVIPPDRFGNLEISGNSVLKFSEKSSGPLSYINGGFFVVSPSVLDRIGNSDLSWEIDVLPKIAREQELNAFLHNGFWMPMDTLRDKIHLEELWQKGDAPWRMW
jgi:glucose-1-phosphate cytidylyltransferase